MSTLSNKLKETSMSIAVIGGGPGGLFICHHLERLRKEANAIASLADSPMTWPQVTCFEKANAPGGVWRANCVAESTPNMYAALWTNGPSHGMEFFDYPFDRHFHQPVTVYLPRAQCLDYILARVQHDCPDFMQRFVRLEHEVQRVGFDDVQKKFVMSVLDHSASPPEQHTHYFDKCVWACGDNGLPYVPQGTVQLLKDGGFLGRILHSTDTHNLRQDVRHRRILLVGGGYSAEDLALQSVKLGARHVYIVSRSEAAEGTDNEQWPYNRVTVLSGYALCGARGRAVELQEAWRSFPHSYKISGPKRLIQNVDTVIFCTGYEMSYQMLDASLRDECFPLYSNELRLDMPKNWKMRPNGLSPAIAADVPCKDVRHYTSMMHPALYRGFLISNPSFAILNTYSSTFPLLALDVYANLLAHHLSGVVLLPSTEAMRAANGNEALELMDMVVPRYEMDEQFRHRVDCLQNFWDSKTGSNPLYDQESVAFDRFILQHLARAMQEGRYPLSLGTYDGLNENGERLLKYDSLSSYHRYLPEKWSRLWRKLRLAGWRRTFRDYNDAGKFTSLITGTPAVPLSKLWMDMELHGDDAIYDNRDEAIGPPSLVESDSNV